MTGQPITAAARSIAHIQPAHWQAADHGLVAKILSEFTHEGLFEPAALGNDTYALTSDDGTRLYRFSARRFALWHWEIRPESVVCTDHDSPAPVDAARLLIDFRDTLGMADGVLSLYLEEIASTRYSAAYKRANAHLKAADFPGADFQAIEAAMTEGCLLYTSPSPRDKRQSRMPSSA